MKAFAVLLVIAFAASTLALTEEQKKRTAEKIGKCIAETKVAKEDALAVEKGVYADKPEFHKYMFCFLKLTELIDDEGHPREDKIKEKLLPDLGEENIKNILEKCKGDEKLPKEQRATAFHKCYSAISTKKVQQ